MNNLLNALNLIVILLLFLGIAIISQHDAGHVTLTWLGWEIQTSVIVLLVTGLIGMTVAFYVGQFTSWLLRRPAAMLAWFKGFIPSPKPTPHAPDKTAPPR